MSLYRYKYHQVQDNNLLWWWCPQLVTRLKNNHAVFTLNDNVKHKNRSKQHVSSILLQWKFDLSFLTRLSVSSFSCLDLFFCLSFLRKTNKQTLKKILLYIRNRCILYMSFLRNSINLKYMHTKCVLETKFINEELSCCPGWNYLLSDIAYFNWITKACGKHLNKKMSENKKGHWQLNVLTSSKWPRFYHQVSKRQDQIIKRMLN